MFLLCLHQLSWWIFVFLLPLQLRWISVFPLCLYPVAPPTLVNLRVPAVSPPVSPINELSVSLPLSPVYQVAAPELTSCLSPGPSYDGPPIDRGALPSIVRIGR